MGFTICRLQHKFRDGDTKLALKTSGESTLLSMSKGNISYLGLENSHGDFHDVSNILVSMQVDVGGT